MSDTSAMILSTDGRKRGKKNSMEGGSERHRTLNAQQRWKAIAQWQYEIDNELHYNPTSAFWQRADAVLQLIKFRTLAIEGTEPLHASVRQDLRT